jgi:hypothetical protein
MPEGKVGGGMGWEAHIESRVFDQVLVALLLQSKVRDADPGGQGGDPGEGETEHGRAELSRHGDGVWVIR